MTIIKNTSWWNLIYNLQKWFLPRCWTTFIDSMTTKNDLKGFCCPGSCQLLRSFLSFCCYKMGLAFCRNLLRLSVQLQDVVKTTQSSPERWSFFSSFTFQCKTTKAMKRSFWVKRFWNITRLFGCGTEMLTSCSIFWRYAKYYSVWITVNAILRYIQ